LDFDAGQFVSLELCINDEKVAKPYSLVNPPGDPVADVFFNTVSSGRRIATGRGFFYTQ